ncbi:MAG: CHAT domain-containing protein [Lewinellaceae bacterium]|nr:CHAT domain-containing protein [Lewinellaceae bacterium]
MDAKIALFILGLAVPAFLFSQSIDSLNNFTIEDSIKAQQALKGIPRLIEVEGKYDEAIELAQSVKPAVECFWGSYSDETSFIYFVTGVALFFKNEYRKAIPEYLTALEIRMKMHGENHVNVAHTCHHLSGCYSNLGEYEKALEYAQLSLRIRKRILSEQSPEIAFSYNNLGTIYASTDQYQEAIDAFQNAKNILIKLFGNNHLYIASIMNNIAACYNSLGRHDNAIELYNQILAIRLKNAGALSREVVESFAGLGNGYNYLGDYYKSVEYFQKALNIFKQLNDFEDVFLGKMYGNLGSSIKSIGDYGRAIDYYSKALNIYMKYYGESHPDIALIYQSIAGVNYDAGDFDEAITYYEKAIEIYKAFSKVKSLSVSNCLYGLAICYWKKGDYDKAISLHQEALLNLPEELANQHPNSALYLNGIATCLVDQGRYEEGIPYYEKCINIINDSPTSSKPIVMTYYTNLGVCYRRMRDFPESIKYFNKTIEIYHNLYKKDACAPTSALIDAYAGMAKVLLDSFSIYNDSRSLYTAYDLFEQAYSAITCQIAHVDAESSKALYFLRVKDIIDNLIGTAMKMPNQSDTSRLLLKSFYYSEISKSNILLDGLINSGAKNFAGIPDSLIETERNLQTHIAFFEKLRYEEEEKGTARNDSLLAVFGSTILTIRQRLDTVLAIFDKDYPIYKQVKYDRPTVSLDYVQNHLIGPNTTFLEYFTGDSSIFLFLINKNNHTILEIKDDFPLEAWTAQLQAGLSAYHSLPPGHPQRTNSFRDSCEQQYITAAQNLYDKLLKPVESQLKEEVILVPDGVLGYIPFEVLLTGPVTNAKRYHQYPYFLKEHLVRYTYSATLLKEMQDKKHRHFPETTFGAFAPYYDGDTTVLEGLDDLFTSKTIAPGDLQPLKYSGAEVHAAQKLMGGDIFIDTSATEERFNQVAGNYRILHLSTHGKADDRVGDYSYLVFNPINDSLENELLYCRDIYNLSLNADLVVLSACETGLGKLSQGEGIISLARAFAYAGAKSIVNSLWSINDASTEQLMVGFYQGIKEGQSKSEALAKAKRRFLETPTATEQRRYEKLGLRWEEFRHPYYWGGFILIGDNAPIR